MPGVTDGLFGVRARSLSTPRLLLALTGGLLAALVLIDSRA
jgi:hypothetical protein